MAKKKDSDVEAVKYILMFLAFLTTLMTLFLVYSFVNELFALIVGGVLVVISIYMIAQNSVFRIMKTTLAINNDGRKAELEVEKKRQEAQIHQLRALNEMLRGDNKVRVIEQKQEAKMLDKQPDFDRRLLTVNDRLLLTDSTIDDGDFRIIEE